MAGLVFQPRTQPAPVTSILREVDGREVRCSITGLDDAGQPCPALSCLIDDSGDGACQLIFGGEWGLRLTDEADGRSWGEPYLMLAVG